MTSSDIQLECLNKLSTAEFCKCLQPYFKVRIANGEDISDLIRTVTGTIAVPALATPAATPAANVEDDDNGTASLDDVHSTIGVNDPHRRQSKRKRVEVTEDAPDLTEDSMSNDGSDVEDSSSCHGRGNQSTLRATERPTKFQRIAPDPLEDMKNFWELCLSLRGLELPEDQIQSQQTRAQQLVTLIGNTDRHIRKDKANKRRHTLELRFLTMEVATMYANKKPDEDEIRRIWTISSPKKPRVDRDVSIDWLTGQLYNVDNFYALDTKDWRRQKVEYWLRIGCPVLTFVNHCGFAALVTPGMRISQNALKASKTGDFETPFIKHLINVFGGFKDELSTMSLIMECWVTTGVPPVQKLNIEYLTESNVRSQTNVSLNYWTQLAYPAGQICHSLQTSNFGSFEANMESLSSSNTHYPAALTNIWPSTQDAAPSPHCRNASKQLPSQMATPTTSELESCGSGTPHGGEPVACSTETPVDEFDFDPWKTQPTSQMADQSL